MERDLEQTPNGLMKLAVKERMDDLKAGIEWLLLEEGKCKEGLAVYESIPWVTHGAQSSTA